MNIKMHERTRHEAHEIHSQLLQPQASVCFVSSDARRPEKGGRLVITVAFGYMWDLGYREER